MSPPLDRRAIRASFDQAAAGYAKAAVLQREVEDRLLERLDYITLEPDRILDLGCGPGRSTAALAERYPEAQVLGMDLSLSMLSQGPRIAPVCADALALPLPDGCCDLVFSNLMLQWCDDPARAFAEFRRVLRPQGLLLFTTFGPDTLMELRHAWAQVDDDVHVNDFFDMHVLGDALIATGFDDPVMDAERLTVTYGQAIDLLRDLKAIGAHHVGERRHRALTAPSRMRDMTAAYHRIFEADGRVPASYELVYGHALGPAPGRPRRDEGMEVASVPVDQLRGSRRQR